MIKMYKKNAFSLAESLISLMILMLVILLTMTTLTRKTLQASTTSSSGAGGMYGCYFDTNGKKIFRKFVGNHQVASNQDNPDTDPNCVFEMDRRISRYYIVAFGQTKCVGGNCVNGQMKVIDTSNIQGSDGMRLDIKLGTQGEEEGAGNTVIKYNDEEIGKALGGISKSDSGLVAENIKDCKYIINANSENPCDPGWNPFCEPSTTGIVVTCKKSNNPDTPLPYSVDDLSAELKTIYSNSNNRFIISEFDPLFKAEGQTTDNSEFVKYIKMLPTSRNNQIIVDLLTYYENNTNMSKNGAVIIMW